MNTRDPNDQLAAANMSRQQAALTAQLFQAVASMHHIDELFQWLSYAFTQRFNIQLLLFWTNHVGPTGQLTAQLRTVARQDASLPDQIVINDQMQRIAQRLISERTAYNPQPVENLFLQYQAILLKRHGLHQWGACFTSRNALLPPRATLTSQGEAPVFFAMTTLLFLQQPAQFSIVSAMSAILDEAAMLAEKRGLLLPIAEPQPLYPQPTFPQYSPQEMAQSMPYTPYTPVPNSSYTPVPNLSYTPVPNPPYTPMPNSPYTPVPNSPYAAMPNISPIPTPGAPQAAMPSVSPASNAAPTSGAPLILAQLIPSRKQDADALLASNPFARPAAIADKKARRLHGAIDGRANINELCSITGLNIQEASVALQILWSQERIEIHEPGGKPVNLPFFLNGR